MNDFGYGSLGYGSGGYPVGMGVSAYGPIIVIVIAAVAIIGLTILGYVKFLGKNSDRNSGFGKFFHFDHFYIEQILRALYLFSFVFNTVAVVAFIIITGPLSGNYLSILPAAIGGAIFLAVAQFLCRVFFESTLITIRQAVDVRALRGKVVGDVDIDSKSSLVADVQDAFGGVQQPQVPNPIPGASAVKQPGPLNHSVPGTWTCSCGSVQEGAFCGRCGRPKP